MSENRPEIEAILKDEYFHLQNSVEKYDQHILTVKQWSVTVSIASISTGFAQHNRWIVLIGALSAGMFWLIDGLWKQFQNAHYYRLRNIEAHINNMEEEHSEFRYPYITISWGSGIKKNKSLWKILLWSQVLLPHAPICLASTTAFFLDLYLHFI
jgi:hypothetical protein